MAIEEEENAEEKINGAKCIMVRAQLKKKELLEMHCEFERKCLEQLQDERHSDKISLNIKISTD